METKPLIDRLAEMLRVPERWMIMDEEGNYHELSSGVKGVTVLGSSKKELNNLFFGKDEISEVQFILLDEIHTALMQFLWNTFSDELKNENMEMLKPVIEKYQLEFTHKN
jgi:hypothetical protein